MLVFFNGNHARSCKGKVLHVIYHVRKILTDAQINYVTTEKKMLALVFAFDKFRFYLINSKVIVYTNHAALKYLFKNIKEVNHVNWEIV